MRLAETITTGLNNPECAFFVGQTLGYGQAGRIILFVGITYFAFKFLDKFVFTQIPKLWKGKRK